PAYQPQLQGGKQDATSHQHPLS
ncbi:hypothetical protein WJX84_001567, partial [Apatococcus fuscideae]